MKLYIKFFMMHLRSQMQYKASFFMIAAGQFLISFSAFVGIYFMFERFGSVRDFTYPEVLLCFAVVLIAFSISECFARGFDTFAGVISGGEFDRALVRPRNEIFLVLASKIELTRVGRLIQAVILLFYAIPTSGVAWSAEKIMLLIVMICSGVVIFSGLFIVYAGICFFTTQGLEFMNIFTDGGREFGRYPFAVYGSGALRFFTYVVPLALFQYYPFLYLIGRSDNRLFMLLPFAGMLFIIPCMLLWRVGIRHYKSTGS